MDVEYSTLQVVVCDVFTCVRPCMQIRNILVLRPNCLNCRPSSIRIEQVSDTLTVAV